MVSANRFGFSQSSAISKTGKSAKETPARNTAKTLVEQFLATVGVTGKKRGGSKPRVRAPDTVGTVRASVASSPAQKSVRQLAAENEESPSTAWPILRTDLRMHPYKIHVSQSLTTVFREKRTRFAEEFGDHLRQNPHTVKHIWFSGDGYFHLTEDINRQNVRFWGTWLSHQIHESTLHAQKVLVLCAVSARSLIGLSMFEDYVTGENYAMMHSGSNRMELELTPLQRSWNSCTPSSSIEYCPFVSHNNSSADSHGHHAVQISIRVITSSGVI